MSVLTPEIAQKFIQRTVKNLPYNVNIMDQAGIIIASKDTSRIGDFHEVANKMLTGGMDSGVVTDKDRYIGTKPGINMFIEYRNENVGVICVTGDPENVQSFAGFVKSSIETMLDYEIHAAQDQRIRGKAERFLFYLLYDDDYRSDEAIRLAAEFDLHENELGTVMIVRASQRINRTRLLSALTRGQSDIHDRIAVVGRNDEIIVLKLFKSGNHETVVRRFKPLVNEYVHEVLQDVNTTSESQDISIYVGSLQERIDNYRISYSHALKNSMLIRKRETINFFYDHIQDYIRSSVTTRLYFEIFTVFNEVFDKSEREMMIDTIRALRANNYNIVKTSQDLYVHRNTVVFRLNKLKDALNIDPITNSADRAFLNELGYYLEKS